jgi:hypothetical protein
MAAIPPLKGVQGDVLMYSPQADRKVFPAH